MIARLFHMRGTASGLAVLVIALFLVVNIGASRVTGWRADLTEEHLFTLSDGTSDLLASLSRPVTITLYYSRALGDALPPYNLAAVRVRQMLRDFALHSEGWLTFTEEEPEPFSESEDDAVAAGLQGVPLDRSGDKVYFGIVARAGDTHGAIPIVQLNRERFLEYDLARLVSAIQKSEQPVVGVWTSTPMFGDMAARMQGLPTQEWALIEELRQQFEVRQILIPSQLKDVDVLILGHPVLREQDAYAVDQFMLRGGKALIFVDPLNEGAASQRSAFATLPVSSNMQELFDTWGVAFDDKYVAGDIKLARVVNAGTDTNIIPAPFVTWMELSGENFSKKDPVTAELAKINLASIGIVGLREDSPLTGEPLLWTTEQSQRIEVEKVMENPPDIRGLAERFKASGERLTLALRMTGEVETAFPDGPPKSEDEKKAAEKPSDAGKSTGAEKSAEAGKAGSADGEETLLPHIARSEAPMNAILVADSDFLSDVFWVRRQQFLGAQLRLPIANNGDFVVNAVENLAGATGLIGLRSRGSGQRPFTRIQEMQFAAQQQFQAKEQQLQRRVEEVEVKLQELQKKAGGGDAAKVGEAQSQEVVAFTKELIATRKDLRTVRRELRRDIDGLRDVLRFTNIALVPILVTLCALVLVIIRRRRRKRATATA